MSASLTLNAIAAAGGYNTSAMASATYTIGTGAPIVNDPSGFASSAGFTTVGGAALQNGALLLTDGGLFGRMLHAVWYATPVNVQSFTSDFNFQLTSAVADGFAFTLQTRPPAAPRWAGRAHSSAMAASSERGRQRFDLFNSAGEEFRFDRHLRERRDPDHPRGGHDLLGRDPLERPRHACAPHLRWHHSNT